MATKTIPLTDVSTPANLLDVRVVRRPLGGGANVTHGSSICR